MTEIAEILGIYLLSMVKFLPAGIATIAAGFSYTKATTILFLGGLSSFLIFYALGKKINAWINKKFQKKSQKKVFSRKNRFIIKVKNKFGVWGISLLSPPLFTIPIGCFLATRFFKNKNEIITKMIISIFIWSLVLPLYQLWS